MKTGRMLFALVLAAGAGTAQAGKDCTELKSEIEAKLQARGVSGYTLDVVAAGETGGGKVVGSCAGGAQRIVYSRGGSEAPAASPAPAPAPAAKAPAPKPATPPAIGNY